MATGSDYCSVYDGLIGPIRKVSKKISSRDHYRVVHQIGSRKISNHKRILILVFKPSFGKGETRTNDYRDINMALTC